MLFGLQEHLARNTMLVRSNAVPLAQLLWSQGTWLLQRQRLAQMQRMGRPCKGSAQKQRRGLRHMLLHQTLMQMKPMLMQVTMVKTKMEAQMPLQLDMIQRQTTLVEMASRRMMHMVASTPMGCASVGVAVRSKVHEKAQPCT